MNAFEERAKDLEGAAREFVTTHWSIVLAAGEGTDTQSAVALQTLCRTYWYPLYCYVRRQGHGPHEAEDLTQGFFLKLLQKNAIAKADPERGRFRTFLLTALKNFLTSEWEKGQAAKRGGGEQMLRWETDGAEERYQMEPVDHQSPDRLYERKWAEAVVQKAMRELESDYGKAGKTELFRVLRANVWGESQEGFAEAAMRLGTTEGALRTAAHRMRDQFRKTLRAEVAQTVSTVQEIDAELRELMQALRS